MEIVGWEHRAKLTSDPDWRQCRQSEPPASAGEGSQTIHPSLTDVGGSLCHLEFLTSFTCTTQMVECLLTSQALPALVIGHRQYATAIPKFCRCTVSHAKNRLITHLNF